MRFGFVVPYADAREFAELAALGEQRGWDGVFTWEAVWGLNAWVTLGAAAMDVGLGALNGNWTAFERDEGRRVRAQKLDECLAVYAGLMRGQPFSYDGAHFTTRPVDELVPDPPVQRPRPPAG